MVVRTLASSSAANCAFINDGSTSLLLDAGLRLKRLRAELGFTVSGIAAALITHSHLDHSRGVHDLATAAVDCYMLPEAAAAIRATGHRIRHVTPHETFRIGTWAVLAFDLVHDVPNVGYLLTSDHGPKVVLITDTAYCPYVFRGVSHAILETNFSEEILRRRVMDGDLAPQQAYRVRRTHLGLDRAIELLLANDRSRLTAVHLVHLSNGSSDAEAFANAVRRATGVPTYVAPEHDQERSPA